MKILEDSGFDGSWFKSNVNCDDGRRRARIEDVRALYSLTVSLFMTEKEATEGRNGIRAVPPRGQPSSHAVSSMQIATEVWQHPPISQGNRFHWNRQHMQTPQKERHE